MQQFKGFEIKAALKLLAKKKDLTYQDLAERLECSVPTVKRYLGTEDLPLSRLLQICDILEVTLTDVELLSISEKKVEEKFTNQQEQFLVKNRGHLAYLFKLLEGLTPSQIAEKNGLNQRSNDKYLIGLEKLGLIRVTGTQKVKPAFKSAPMFGEGVLGRAYFRSLIELVSQFFITVIDRKLRLTTNQGPDPSKPSSRFSVNKVKISKASYDEWVKLQDELLKNLDNLSNFEQKSKAPEELQTMVCTVAHTLVPSDSPELEVFDHAFGEIKNLS